MARRWRPRRLNPRSAEWARPIADYLASVTPDEKTLLFSTDDFTDGTKGVPKNSEIYEATLDATVSPPKVGSPAMKHEEPQLKGRYATWISDDGCAAIFANGDNSIYARRD